MPLIASRVLLLAFFCIVGLWASERPAAAQTCSFTITAMSFGSFETASGAAVTTTATLNASCSASILSGITTAYVCPYIGDGGGGSQNPDRTMANGTNKLRFQMYSSGTTIWGSPGWNGTTAARLSIPLNSVNVINLTRNGTGSWPINGTVFGGQQSVAAGAYTSAMSGVHMNFMTGSSSTICGGGTTTAQPSFTVSATVLAGCTISADDITFPNKGVLDSVTDAEGAVKITCSNGTPWTAALALGTGETATARTMSLTGQTDIKYGLYKDTTRATPWAAGAQAATGTGNGALQSIPVYARVPVVTGTQPAAGTYSDTVVVTLTY